MRYLLTCLLTAVSLAAQAGPPQLFLDVARFRNLNKVEKGGEVEIYVTVPSQSLTYRQRAPKAFQAAATVTLEVLKADGKPAYREVVTLKPPVQNDTTMMIKNPQSFLKRILLPDGKYTLRGTVRDLYRAAGGSVTVEKPLLIGGPAAPFLSDIILLARPAVKNAGDSDFNRGGYLLTRAPAGLYGRGAEQLHLYTELQNGAAGQPLRVHYQIMGLKTAAADVTVTPQAGRPTPVLGTLPLGALPDGEFTVLVDVFNGAKLLTSQRVTGRRNSAEFVPAAAPPAR